MTKGWVIYSKDTLSSKFGDNAFDWMKEAALRYDLDVEILFEEDFTLMTSSEGLQFYLKGQRVITPDFVMMRSYGLDLARHLESAGVKVFNSPHSMASSQDKWQTHQLLAKQGLSSPDSVVGSREIGFEAVKTLLGLPFVAKGLYGSKGEEVFLIHSQVQFDDMLQAVPQDKVMYQRFVAQSAGTDIRIHVIGGQVVAAVRRRSEGDFKSNFHQGGSAEPVELTEEMKELSIRASAALELDFAGVDLLESQEGVTVCEVNAIPGFRTVCITSETDIPNLLFEYISSQLD